MKCEYPDCVSEALYVDYTAVWFGAKNTQGQNAR